MDGRALLSDGLSAWWRFSERRDGDLRVSSPPRQLAERRRALVDLPWAWNTQVHGAAVRTVLDETDLEVDNGAEADALVTNRPGVVLSVNVADCAAVALLSPQGVIGAVHAGWRGLHAGVVESAVDAMRNLGARVVTAWLGPCIHPECYEFGADDLATMAERYGPAVRARSATGTPALDLPMAVAAALGRARVELMGAAEACTGCDPGRFYSFRARRNEARHALAVWLERGRVPAR
jgi:YfiH family protein